MQFELGSYATTMARYNHWMNDSLYTAAAALTPQQLRTDCGLFFGSVYATLNHLLACDRMWLARFRGEPVTITSIRQQLYDRFRDLQHARRETDRDIINWAHTLAVSPPPERLHYVSLAQNTPRDVDFTRAIMHFFNHHLNQ